MTDDDSKVKIAIQTIFTDPEWGWVQQLEVTCIHYKIFSSDFVDIIGSERLSKITAHFKIQDKKKLEHSLVIHYINTSHLMRLKNDRSQQGWIGWGSSIISEIIYRLSGSY